MWFLKLRKKWFAGYRKFLNRIFISDNKPLLTTLKTSVINKLFEISFLGEWQIKRVMIFEDVWRPVSWGLRINSKSSLFVVTGDQKG